MRNTLMIAAMATATTAHAVAPVDGADLPAATGYTIVEAAQGLDRPWGIAWLPDGSALITERGGLLRVLKDGMVLDESVAGVPEVFASGQGGLLDVSLHPKFAENRFVYLTYSHGTRESNRTRLGRGVLDGMTLRDFTVLFEPAQSKDGTAHFGSRLTWLPDGTLLVSVGDGGNPPTKLDGDWIRMQAQNPMSALGKVHRLRDDGTIPDDNPFAGREGHLRSVYSMGHRNVQGLLYDPVLGHVWATEHGARGGDELNRVEAGRNYGWPLVTFSVEYRGGAAISPDTSKDGFVDPLVAWTPCPAPSGLVLYRGDKLPQWRGDLLSGGLAGQDVRVIDLDDAGKVVGQSRIPVGKRVRDVRQGPDGYIYLLTDEQDGQLLRIEPVKS